MSVNYQDSSKHSPSLTKLLIGLFPIVLLGSAVGSQISVNASSNNDEVSCYERGLIDGEDHPFNQCIR